MLSKLKVGRALPWLRAKANIIAGLVLLFLILTWRLGSSPSNLSPLEKATVATSNLGSIMRNPIYAPFRFLQDFLIHINHSVFFSRLAAVFIAMLFATTFYYLLKGWFGRPIALLTTTILLFTPYFLLASRSATPAIMFFISALVLAAYSAASRHPGDRLPVLLLALTVCLSLYVPGMVWLIIIVGAYRYTRLKDIAFQADLNARFYIVIAFISLVALLPLLVGLSTHPEHLKQWFLVPDSIPGVSETAKAWGWSLSALAVQARTHQELMISKLPLLDAAQIGLLIFGAFVMWSRLRRDFYAMAGICIFITFLSGLNNSYAILALALPLLTIVIGMGLRYLYIEWRYVFPINPMAKSFAIALMSILVITHVLLGIRYSLVAWPVTTVAASSSSMLK